jgi:tetratricopeptide (TPR) repeat protein
MSDHRQRAELLLQQSRFDLAEKELRQALLADPNDARAHSLLGFSLSEQEKFDEATQEAELAIHLSPDADYGHFVLAHVLFRRNRYTEARAAIGEAIRIDPFNATYHGVLAGIQLAKRRWSDALSAAEAGLEIDPEDAMCANYRAMALVQLGRRKEAGHTLESSLSKDPDNADTHASQGWALLHAGDPSKAMEHFREALRLEPTSEFARSGIVEAMKARNPVYRVMLGYFLWFSKLGRGAQWGLIIGGYIAFRFVRRIADDRPDLAPYLWPFLGAYLVFAVLSWLSVPLFNLILRLDRFGRLALSRDQIIASNWVGGCLLTGIVFAFVGWIVDVNPLIGIGVVLLLLLFPLSGTFHCDVGWPRNAMAIATVVLAVLGFSMVAAVESESKLAGILSALFVLGFIASTWAAVALITVTPKN